MSLTIFFPLITPAVLAKEMTSMLNSLRQPFLFSESLNNIIMMTFNLDEKQHYHSIKFEECK